MEVVAGERHHVGRVGWLRAAVLGTNDGVLSTSSLLLGVAAAHATHGNVMVAGIASLVAGAMSMAAGEYVSVSSQADTERADLQRERAELKADDAGEHRELAAIYVSRGLAPLLAKQVAEQLMAHDALGTHARDELGISDNLLARPIQAAFSRKLRCRISTAAARHCPRAGRPFDPARCRIFIGFSRVAGRLGRSSGGFGRRPRCGPVTFWGALAMGITAGIGSLFGTTV